MKKLTSILILLALATLATAAPRKQHLLIFVGENSMEMIRPERSIIPALKKDKEIRRDNILWLRETRRKFSMRDFDLGWKTSEISKKKRLGNKYKATQTSAYKRLVVKARQAARKKKCDTIILFWSLGETDAKEGWGDTYEASFQRFISQLQADLDLGEIKVVITRLSDHGHDSKRYPGWHKVRDAQAKIVKSNKSWSLINTDDMNGKMNKLQLDKKGLERLNELYTQSAKQIITEKNSAAKK